MSAICTVGIVGAATMGIAFGCAASGIASRLYDITPGVAEQFGGNGTIGAMRVDGTVGTSDTTAAADLKKSTERVTGGGRTILREAITQRARRCQA
jgi:hypothetical protein